MEDTLRVKMNLYIFMSDFIHVLTPEINSILFVPVAMIKIEKEMSITPVVDRGLHTFATCWKYGALTTT